MQQYIKNYSKPDDNLMFNYFKYKIIPEKNGKFGKGLTLYNSFKKS